MDPLTHTLAGAALGETGLGRGSRHARAALLIGANLPDVDALAYLAGSDTAFAFRRGITHGVLAVSLWPVLLAGLLYGAGRLGAARVAPGTPPVRFGRLLLASAVAVTSHPLLDWLNTYGIRLLMPFDERWLYGDAVFIIDPWLWLLLGGSTMLARAGERPGLWVWGLLGVLASLAVLGSPSVPRGSRALWLLVLAALCALRGARGWRPGPQVVARVGVALAALYIALLVASSATGRAWLRPELERQGLRAVEQVLLSPRPADPLRWDAVIRTGGEYRHGVLRWPYGPELRLAERGIPMALAGTVVEAARASPCIAGTLGWMRLPFAEVEPTPGGYTVRFLDARYVRERARGFGSAAVELDRDLVPRDCAGGS